MNLEQIDTFQANFCAEQLKALSEPMRLRIVDLLRDGPLSVSDITAKLQTEVATASHHLQILKNANLVSTRRDGRFIYYDLRDGLLQKRGKSKQQLNLGCCSIEIPSSTST
ncbi:ArsR/SmtB family transcription factor [Planctomicrobium sp. SH668]|uniref:ArsR/SmtB family transcription factor n=1 Tax=Planctomicrobium sp. SH668 TaxID=3448126 RepID=UPI003F5BF60D